MSFWKSSMSICFMVLLFVTVLSSVLVAADKTKQPKREICITFDELPASTGFHDVDRQAISYLILQALKKHDIKAAGFVVGHQIEGSFDLLGEWLNAGHVLGSQTFTHQDYNQTEIEPFISDVESGRDALETMLSGFGQKKRYFRFPFHHYGNTADKKEQIQLFLDESNYDIVPASVVIEDYLYNLTFEKMGKTPDSADYEALMNEYINHVLDEIEASEKLSKQVLKRPCKQILSLRANRLNAVMLKEMLMAIKNMGYEFVDVNKALKDKLYRMPEAYFGSRGVSYIEMIMNSDPDHLPAQ